MTLCKRILSCFFIICILCSAVACSNQDSGPFPQYYTGLSDSLGKTADIALDILKASNSGLSPDQFGSYYVPVKVSFHGIDFDTVGLGFYQDSLFTFTYHGTLNGNAENKAASVSDLALYLREAIGKTEEERHSHPELDPSFEELYSTENLAQWFSETTNDSKSATWVIGDLKTESAKTLYDSLMATARHEKERYHDNLALRMTLTVRKYENGNTELSLNFEAYLYYGSEFKTAQS